MNYTLPLATLLVAMFCLGQTAYAEENVPDTTTLLWRISGNELAQPSYLYGTMHLRDARVFDFADSVIPHFNLCEGYAMESTPDSAMSLLAYSYNYELAPGLATVSEDSLPPLTPDVSMSSFIHQTRNSWHSRQFMTKQEGEYPTILDFYLYRLARNQGKVTSSLESPTDIFRMKMELEKKQYQRASANEGTAEYEKKPDFMRAFAGMVSTLMMGKAIRLYREGRIDDLLALTELSFGEEESDLLLTQRNYGMAASMKTLMRERPTFVAVGTAHLGGKNGLINILRNEGYTVTPIAEVRNEPADELHDSMADCAWYTYSSPTGSYSVEFPDIPTRLPLDLFRTTAAEFNTVIYPDLTSNITYVVSHTDVLKSLSEQEIDSVINACSAALFTSSPQNASSGKVQDEGGAEQTDETEDADDVGSDNETETASEEHTDQTEDETHTGYISRYAMTGKGQLIREDTLQGNIRGKRTHVRMPDNSCYTVQYSVYKGRVFILMAIAPGDTVFPREIQRFFSSFSPNTNQIARPSVFSARRGAYTISFPDRFDTAAGYPTSSLWVNDSAISCTDPATGIFYRTGFQDLKANPITDDPLYIAMYASLTLPSDTVVTIDTLPGKLLVYNMLIPDVHDTVRCRLIQRGLRLYYILADIPAGVPSSAADVVFDSFRTIDFIPASTQQFALDSLGLAITLPGIAEENIWTGDVYDILRTAIVDKYNAQDSVWYTIDFDKTTVDLHSGSRYRLRVVTLGKYFYTQSIDSLLVHTAGQTGGSSDLCGTGGRRYGMGEIDYFDPTSVYEGEEETDMAYNVESNESDGELAIPGAEPIKVVISTPHNVADTPDTSAPAPYLPAIRTLAIGPFQARLLMADSNTTRNRHTMVALRGNRAYILTATTSADKSDSLLFENCIASLRLDDNAEETTAFSPKATRLFEDLRNDMVPNPVQVIARYPFSTADLPEIYRILTTPLPNDTAKYLSTRSSLLQVLSSISDSTTVPFLGELIPQLASHPSLQYHATSLLVRQKSSEAVATLAALLPSLAPDNTLILDLLPQLYGTRRYAKILLPAMLPLVRYPNWQSEVYNLIEIMRDSGTLAPADILAIKDTVLANLRGHVATYGAGDNNSPSDTMSMYRAYDLAVKEIGVLAMFGNEPDIANELEELADSRIFGEAAVMALLRSGHQLDLSDYDELIETPYQCLSLYRKLEEAELLHLFPAIDDVQEKMAQGLVEHFLMNREIEFPSDVRLVAVREIADGPKAGRYYLFSITRLNPYGSYITGYIYDDDDSPSAESENQIVLLNGPHPLDKTQFSTSSTTVYSKSDSMRHDSADKQFENLLAEVE